MIFVLIQLGKGEVNMQLIFLSHMMNIKIIFAMWEQALKRAVKIRTEYSLVLASS